jgi:hypothetical protein
MEKNKMGRICGTHEDFGDGVNSVLKYLKETDIGGWGVDNIKADLSDIKCEGGE